MWLPLLILCIGATGVGYLGVFGGHGHEGGWFHSFVGRVTDKDVAADAIYEAANPGKHTRNRARPR